MWTCTWLGDCLEQMKKIPDGAIDMVLCDLPYGTTQNKWESVLPLEPLWLQYKRICKGAIVLTAAQPFTSTLVINGLNQFKQELVWEKNVASNFMNANRLHLARHEDVLVFAFGRHPYNPQLAPGKPYIQKRKGKDDTGSNYGAIKERTDTINDGTRKPISVLKFDRQIGLHPTQKPVALMQYLIKTYTNEGMTVLDNCMGSGTTGVACVNTNRNFVGIEQDEKYFEIACKRIEDAKAALTVPTENNWVGAE